MKGRAYALIEEFKQTLGASERFGMARLILRTGVIPEDIDEETDDEELEKRLESAIKDLSGPMIRSPG